jgi:hypothetical protein
MKPYGEKYHENVMQTILYADAAITRICAEHHQDYRDRHTTAIALEIAAFEEWRNTPDPNKARIKRKIGDLLHDKTHI